MLFSVSCWFFEFFISYTSPLDYTILKCLILLTINHFHCLRVAVILTHSEASIPVVLKGLYSITDWAWGSRMLKLYSRLLHHLSSPWFWINFEYSVSGQILLFTIRLLIFSNTIYWIDFDCLIVWLCSWFLHRHCLPDCLGSLWFLCCSSWIGLKVLFLF